MKKLLAIAGLLLATTTAAFSATEKEEEFASKSAAILLLATGKCDLGTFNVEKLMSKINAAYDTAGVHPSDYKQGEWVRKVFFTISQTDYLREIDAGNPQVVRAFCNSISAKFPHQ
jgi:hypothetical protein